MRKQTLSKKCEVCRRKYNSSPSKQRKFCSRKCWFKSIKRGKNSLFWKQRIRKNCLCCKKVFYLYPSKKERLYCSLVCYRKDAKRFGLRGNKHPSYTGGLDKSHVYLRKSWKELAEKCYKRDKYTCQICGLGRNKVQLVAHHKIPRDMVKKDNLYNLITLCRGCHRRLEVGYAKTMREGKIPFFLSYDETTRDLRKMEKIIGAEILQG